MSEHTPDLKARSPWSNLHNLTSIEIHPLDTPIETELQVPGSKSFTNRALILAALAAGTSNLQGILKSDDSYWCIDSLKKLGIRIEVKGNSVRIEGSGGQWPHQSGKLYIGASGTTARFLPGALAAAETGQWTIDASRSMTKRPLGPLLDALNAIGAEIKTTNKPGYLPITVEARGLQGGDVSISGSISSQFLSGLLLASPYAKNQVTIHVTDPIVQHAYIHITLDLMQQFGAEVHHDDNLTTFTILPAQYQAQSLALEADASTASYFFAVAALTGGTVTVTNLNPNTHQPDVKFVGVLEKMGCRVRYGEHSITVEGPAQLRGGFSVSFREFSDQALTLAAIAPFADGIIEVREVEHIRKHESDRVQAAVANLRRLGVQCEEHQDGFTVHPGRPQAARLPSYDDHRVAMSFALVGLRTEGIEVLDPGCVSKTCPTYFDLLREIGIRVTEK
ncbi:3-phosphoshikimate 1-carboxyvinyltransferase [Alicyclobacillus sp. SO9]|uniref:3-phosphoshikimate 1-carboxyvinyltransferase n=1 Tax=Alicyclobacillus sp. SO9 TaxID=2665646 RepID=UPI0018E73845|nr:3-phosphoshikimate 1-carboxyvinyltransferase [Alicyclobacillus sp. SO9]QQE81049.1 3-phosphoshikimate 1-carboxyvinyltransferase [Alicyclobacillus sp. SO9]